MSNITTTVRAKVASATTPTIYNLSMPTANVEYSQALNPQTKKITIRARINATIQLAFIAGNTGTEYITIPPGCSYSEDGLDLSGVIIYIQSSQPGQVAEILEWV